MTKYFLQIISENAESFPERVAYCMEDGSRALTYGGLWKLSGRICTKLMSLCIGREDIVMIILPRDPLICAAMFGVWRAGAALTMLEDNCPPERVEYIRKDVGCKLTIDKGFFEDIEEYEPAEGFVPVDRHDAAFAIYTSGTTGKPKGILHEYGKFDFFVQNSEFEMSEREGFERYANPAPFQFVAALITAVNKIIMGDTMYLVSSSLIRDFERYKRFLEHEKIASAFMAPSMLRFYKKPSRYLRMIQAGSEPANGIYYDNLIVRNKYTMSEAVFFVAEFDIDRPYEKTPVGKNRFGLELHLLDEHGREAANGEQGEICFENPYTRGYINLPDETARAFRDGLFHSGDLGYKNEDGNLVISGRMDDMIKVNGNRIDPAEIEAAAKSILGVHTAIAKGFTEDRSAFVALYCLKSELADAFDPEKIGALKNRMGERLPSYMVPSYYIGLDALPLNANGKVSRLMLPEPDRRITAASYKAPETELQKKLCEAMGRALGITGIGLNDDFFSLGGNSIAVMSFLSEFDDPRLGSSLLYRYPSPGALAVYCEKESINGLSGRTDRISYIREQAQKQRERYDTSESFPAFYASSQGTEDNMIRNVLWNPEISFTLREAPDPVRLQTAVDRAVRSCPYVGLSIEKKEGLLYFKKNALPLLVFTKEKNDSLRVFGSDEENRHYARVTLSGRKVIFSISHAITDGYGFNCFIQAVLDYYFGKEETRYKGADSPDYAADLMEFPLPLSGKQALPDPVPESHFVIPEIQNMQRITPRMFRASIPVSVMNAFMKRCRVGAQTVVSYLLALTVMRVHPENRLPISIRGPVNTRRIFGVPDSFQNASVPHVYLCADPEALSGTDHTCLLSEMQESFERQLSFENLANETNRMSEALRFGDPEEFARTVKAYGMKTGLLANYMGEIISDDLNGYIDETAVRLPAPFPIAVYAFNMGEQTHFEMVLTFPGDAYAEAFKNLLEEIKDGDYHD